MKKIVSTHAMNVRRILKLGNVASALLFPIVVITFTSAFAIAVEAKDLKPWSPVVQNAHVNTLGMPFVEVPDTEVLFCRWETRVKDYAEFVREAKREVITPDFKQGATHPVVNVSWEDAMLFCHWLTLREQRTGKINSDQYYRLPTSLEWTLATGQAYLEPEPVPEPVLSGTGQTGNAEDASTLSAMPGKLTDQATAKAGAVASKVGEKVGETVATTMAKVEEAVPVSIKLKSGERSRLRYQETYVWGSQWPPQAPVGNFGERLGIDPYPYTAPVGSFAPNRFGIHDLEGNVREWCMDTFGDSANLRVLRGASWRMNSPGDMRVDHEVGNTSDIRFPAYGFRLVLARQATSH